MNKDHIETEDMKFIWGVKSYDDLTDSEPNFTTLNDIELIYIKKENKYIIAIETIYLFENREYERKYLKRLLQEFEVFVTKNGYNVNKELNLYEIFTNKYNINSHFDTIEEAYSLFKILVNGY